MLDPYCCGQLLLAIYSGISDDLIRAHRRNCVECQELIATLGPTKYDREWTDV